MSAAPHRCVVHRGHAGLDALRARWEAASAKVGGRYFTRWGWWDAYLSALEPKPDAMLFCAVEDGAELLAVVPLRESRVVQRGVPLRVLSLPRHDHLPLAGVLHAPELSLDDLLSALAAGLEHAGVAWDALSLSHVLAEKIFEAPPTRWAWRTQIGHVKTCDEVRCEQTWEAIEASLSPKFRKNLNQSVRKSSGPGFRYGVASDPAEMAALYPQFLALEAAGWKGEERTAIAQDPKLDAFYRGLLGSYGAAGRARISYLMMKPEGQAERMIAVQFCVVDDRTLYVLKLAYDESVPSLGPGHLMLRHMMRTGDFDAVNLVGSPPWFLKWKPAQTDVRKLTVFNVTPRGALLLAAARARTAARPWVRKLKEARARRSEPSPAPATP